MYIFKNTNYDFLRWRWQAIAVSWIIIIAGIISIWTKGIPKGVEFASGTVVIVQFDQPTSVQQLRTALDKGLPGGGESAVVQAYGDPGQRQVMIRVPLIGAESGGALSAGEQQIVKALKQGNFFFNEAATTEIV